VLLLAASAGASGFGLDFLRGLIPTGSVKDVSRRYGL
jgi:hypothetical protein